MKYQVSQPYKTTGETMLLYTLICIYTADGNMNDLDVNGNKHYRMSMAISIPECHLFLITS